MSVSYLKSPVRFLTHLRMSFLMHQDPYCGLQHHSEEAFLHHPGLLAFLTSSPSLSPGLALSFPQMQAVSPLRIYTHPSFACFTFPLGISRNTSFKFLLKCPVLGDFIFFFFNLDFYLINLFTPNIPHPSCSLDSFCFIFITVYKNL